MNARVLTGRLLLTGAAGARAQTFAVFLPHSLKLDKSRSVNMTLAEAMRMFSRGANQPGPYAKAYSVSDLEAAVMKSCYFKDDRHYT